MASGEGDEMEVCFNDELVTFGFGRCGLGHVAESTLKLWSKNTLEDSMSRPIWHHQSGTLAFSWVAFWAIASLHSETLILTLDDV